MSNPPKRFSAISQQMRQIGKSATLASMYGTGGPGSPVALMTGHLKRVVMRYRQVKPFPIPSSAFFESVFPLELFLERTSCDPRWMNLAKTLNVERVGHFHIDGRDSTHETFWVKHTGDVPSPRDLSMTLLFAKSNAHFDVVNQWVTEALRVHEEVDEILEYLRTFVASVQHPGNVDAHWPELKPFVGYFPDTVWKHPVKVRKNEVSVPNANTRAKITDMLATCSLLSDVELTAWVKFPEHLQ